MFYTTIGSQKLSAIPKEMKSPTPYYDEVEMKSHSKSAIEAPYEECGGGVTSSNVAMEENPAYQSVDVAAAKPWAVESKMEANFCVTTQMCPAVNNCVSMLFSVFIH